LLMAALLAAPAAHADELVLDTANPLADFAVEGSQFFTPGPGALVLHDQSVSDLVNFYGEAPFAAPGTTVDLIASFQIRTATCANADCGVRFVINDGSFKALVAAAVEINGVKGFGLASGTNFIDLTNYPVFVPVNWTRPTTLHIRRWASGDGEILAIDGITPDERAFLDGVSLPPRNRITPTVEFGVASVETLADFEITALRAFTVSAIPEPQAYVLLLAGLGLLGFAARRRRAAQNPSNPSPASISA